MDSSISVTLISLKDNTRVDIDIRGARHAGLLKNLIEEYQDENELSIPEIEGDYLKYIAEFLNYYKETDPIEVPKPLEEYSIANTYGKWDEEFVSQFKEKKTIWALLEAAYYIDCKPLLELVASYIAIKLKDCSGEEMLNYFELKEDMTDEDVIKMEEEFEKDMEQQKEEEIKKAEELKKDDFDNEEI